MRRDTAADWSTLINRVCSDAECVGGHVKVPRDFWLKLLHQTQGGI